MKLNKMLTLLFAMCVLFSCSDDDNKITEEPGTGGGGNKESVYLPSLIKADWELNGSYNNATHYEYDSSLRITKCTNYAMIAGGNQSTITFTYNADGTVATQVVDKTVDGVKSNYTVTFSHTPGKATASFTNNGVAHKDIISIDNNSNITAIESQENGVVVSNKVVTYANNYKDVKVDVNNIAIMVSYYDDTEEGIYKNINMPQWLLAYALENYAPKYNWIQSSVFYPSETGGEDYQDSYTFHQGYQAEGGFVYESTYYEFDWAAMDEYEAYGVAYNVVSYTYEYISMEK